MPSPTTTSARRRRASLALVCLGIALFTWGTTYMNWVKYVSLRSSWAFDLGFFNNANFNYVHGRSITYIQPKSWFDPTDREGPSIYRSNHFSPMQFLLIPQLYRVAPYVLTLMLVQSLVIGSGALPLYLFLRERTKRELVALLGAFCFLLHPIILHLAFNDYRTVAFGVSLTLFALWLHATGRIVAFSVAALFMLTCRPEYALALALFPLINWAYRPPRGRRLLWWLTPLVMAGLWALLANAYYWKAYDEPWPLMKSRVAAPPGPLMSDMVTRFPSFIRLAGLPLVVGLAAPEVLAAALPFVAGAGHLGPHEFPYRALQHLSPALALVFWAFALGLARLWPWLSKVRWRARVTLGGLLAGCLVIFAQFAYDAADAYLFGGYSRHDWIDRADAALPPDATVMVPIDLTARFSSHTRVLVIDWLPLGRTTALTAEQLDQVWRKLVAHCDLIVTGADSYWLDPLIAGSGRYDPPQYLDGYHMYVARPSAPRAPDPDKELQRALRWDLMPPTVRVWCRVTDVGVLR